MLRRGGTALAAILSLTAAAALSAVTSPPARAADAAPTAAQVFTQGYETSKVVTLTFEADGVSPDAVQAVLDTLHANGITAAFALTGQYVETYPAQVRAIAAAGHKLVNHGYDHTGFAGLTQEQRWQSLDRTEGALTALGLTSVGWFRAPGHDGYNDPGVNADLAARSYYVNFDYTWDNGDLGYPSTDLQRAPIRLAVPGGIVLMHLTAGPHNAYSLQLVINTLRSIGYGFTTPYRTVTKGAIGAKYAALGAERFTLGAPRTAEMEVTEGTYVQWFQGGRIYWSPATGAHEVHGDILAYYIAYGSATSFLGFPVTDEATAPDGIGRYNHFQGGSVYWTPGTGAHEVHGLIREKWAAMGWERSFLGYPTQNEWSEFWTGARYNQFQGGNIYWSAATGAWAVHGAILTRLTTTIGPGPYSAPPTVMRTVGPPVTDEMTTPDGIGRYNHFQQGSIYWSPATGAWEIWGPIRDKWASLGWEQSFLHYPTTQVLRAARVQGYLSRFEGGVIYHDTAPGTHEVHGVILAKYLAMGEWNGFLGFPTTDEYAVTGGRASQFQGGHVYWSAATSAHEVHGAILARYLQLGATASRLGHPVSDEYGVSDGRRSDFQHGAILWNASTGATTVYYW